MTNNTMTRWHDRRGSVLKISILLRTLSYYNDDFSVFWYIASSSFPRPYWFPQTKFSQSVSFLYVLCRNDSHVAFNGPMYILCTYNTWRRAKKKGFPKIRHCSLRAAVIGVILMFCTVIRDLVTRSILEYLVISFFHLPLTAWYSTSIPRAICVITLYHEIRYNVTSGEHKVLT